MKTMFDPQKLMFFCTITVITRLGAGTCGHWCGGDGSTTCGGVSAMDFYALEDPVTLQVEDVGSRTSSIVSSNPLEELLRLHNAARWEEVDLWLIGWWLLEADHWLGKMDWRLTTWMADEWGEVDFWWVDELEVNCWLANVDCWWGCWWWIGWRVGERLPDDELEVVLLMIRWWVGDRRLIGWLADDGLKVDHWATGWWIGGRLLIGCSNSGDRWLMG